MTSRIFNYLEKIIKTDVRYVAKGGFWFGFSHFVAGLLALASATAFANLLPKESYGIYRYGLSILSLLTLTALPGLDDSLTRSVARGFEGDFLKCLKTRMKWGILGSGLAVILALYYYLNGNTTLFILMLIIGIFIPFLDSPLVYNSFLAGRKNFKTSSLSSNISSFLTIGAVILTLLFTKNIFLIITAYLAASALSRIGTLIFVYKKYPPNSQREPGTINYGKKLSLINLLSNLAGFIDNLIVFNFLGAGDLAAYSFIKKAPDQIKVIPKFTAALSAPKFATQDIDNPALKKDLLRKSFFFSLFLLIIALIYVGLAPFVFKIFFGPYKEYVFLSQIYALSLPFGSFGTLLLSFLESTRQEKALVRISIISPLIKIAVMFSSVMLYGLWGLIISFLIMRLLNPLLITFFFLRLK